MKYFFTFLLLFIANQAFNQNCSNIVLSIDEAAGINETFQISFINYSLTGTLYIEYRNDIYYSQTYDSDGCLYSYQSIDSPGEYKYTITPWIDGFGECNSRDLWISIFKTVTQYYSIRSNSILKACSGHVFFVNSLGELSIASQAGDVWYDVPLNYYAPKVKSGTRFTEETSDGVFYVGADQKIYALKYDNGWNYYCLNTSLYARGNSDLEVTGSQVFYINNDRKISSTYKDGSSWVYGVFCPTAPKIKNGTGMSRETSNGIYYISENNQLISLKWNNGWTHTLLCNYINGRSDTDVKVGNGDYSVFWIGADNRMYMTYQDGSTWTNISMNSSAPQVKDGCDFYVNTSNDNIYYIGRDDNRIYKLYHDGSYWQYEEAVDRQMEAKGGITLFNGDLFFTRNDDNKMYYYESSTLKSAEIEKEKVVETNIRIFPNPTQGRSYIRLPKGELEKSANITVHNSSGQIILRKDNLKSGYIDITGNPTGIYYLSVDFGNYRKTEKIILK